MEYGAAIWDPHLKTDIDRLEKIPNRAIRFIQRDYHSRDHGCIDRMRNHLELQTLQERRREIRLTLFFKIAQGLTPAIQIQNHLTPLDNNKRKIRARQFENFVT